MISFITIILTKSSQNLPSHHPPIPFPSRSIIFRNSVIIYNYTFHHNPIELLVTIVVVVVITIINNITIVILIVIVIIMGITIIIVIIVVVIIFIIFFIIIMNLNPLPNHFILSRCPGRNGKGVQLLKAPRRRQAADLDAPVALVRDLHPHAQLVGLTNLAQFQQLHQGRHKG